MKVRLSKSIEKNKNLGNRRLEPFVIDKSNRHLFDREGNVYLRKSRLSTVITVDVRGNILNIEGINPKKLEIGNNIYDI